ncbi:MAG: hypothetical protein M3394_01465 [Actinomycetota bacterium]|nr:hypothetical protein [Actinomycetota bacterium]
MGAVFGSKRYKQFRPPVREGYIVYPTLRQRRADIEEHLEGTVERVLRRTVEG